MSKSDEEPGDPKSRSWTSRFRRVTSSKRAYYPEIDGLRFIAIVSVLLFHVANAATGGLPGHAEAAESRLVFPHVAHGARGVELFFAISGFILGLPFARHFLEGAPKVGLGKYLTRRVTRLEPPYVAALVGFYVLAFALRMPDSLEGDFWPSFWLRLVYGYGLVHWNAPTLNGVTWSLEIEVQFYLLAPLLANVFRLPTGPRRVLLTSVVIGSSFLAAEFMPLKYTVLGFLHFFMIGFLLADFHVTAPQGGGSGRFRAFADVAGLIGLAGLFTLTKSVVLTAFMPWLVALVMIAAMRGAAFRSACSIPVVSIIGGMCYSLYLIHYPIMSFLAGRMDLGGMSQLEASLRLGALSLPVVFVAGSAFYLLIERPCMVPDWPRRLVGWFSGKGKAG